MSISWLDVEPRPAILVLPPAAASLDEAHAAIELWEHYSGKVLDLSQRLVVEVLMAQTSVGRWAAATTGREMSRQNGKGDEIEVVELWGLVQRAEAILHTVHDAVLLATQTQQRMLGVLESHSDLRRLKKREWLGTGQQMIEMHNGGVIWYRTRTGGGGRGVDDIARLVVDEAQHAVEEQMAAVTPTLMANDDPQMNMMGTAAIAGSSAWWWRIRKRALSGDPGAFGYVGHTAEVVRLDGRGGVVQDPVDPLDRALWVAANPSVGAGRGGGMVFLEEQLQRLGPAKFAREHLCVWDPEPDTGSGGAFDVERWLAAGDAGAERGRKVVFGVDVGEDRAAHVAVAWRRPGGVHVMLADSGLSPSVTPARLAELARTWKGPVMLGGPAAALDGEVPRSSVVSSAEFAASCGRFDDLLRAGEIRHGNQPELNEAVRVARWRSVGTAGERAFQLKDAPAVGPLAAVVRALHGLLGGAVKPSAEPRVVSARSETADLSSLSF